MTYLKISVGILKKTIRIKRKSQIENGFKKINLV